MITITVSRKWNYTCQMASSGQSLTTGMVKPAKIAFPGLGPKTVTFRVAGKKNGPDQ